MDIDKIKKLAGIKTSGDYLKIIQTDKKLRGDSSDDSIDTDVPDELDSEITSLDDIDAEERNNAEDAQKDSGDTQQLISSTYDTLRQLTWEFVDNFFINMETMFGANITNDFINNKYSEENYFDKDQSDISKWVEENIKT